MVDIVLVENKRPKSEDLVLVLRINVGINRVIFECNLRVGGSKLSAKSILWTFKCRSWESWSVNEIHRNQCNLVNGNFTSACGYLQYRAAEDVKCLRDTQHFYQIHYICHSPFIVEVWYSMMMWRCLSRLAELNWNSCCMTNGNKEKTFPPREHNRKLSYFWLLLFKQFR